MGSSFRFKQTFHAPGVLMLGGFVSAFLLLLGSSAPAHAFNTFHALIDDPVPQVSDSVSTTPIKHAPSPSMADSCLPLLKSIRSNTPSAVMDRNQRSAGNAAEAGLFFGVRFALSPPEKPARHARSANTTNASLGFWQVHNDFTGDRPAQVVSARYTCGNDSSAALKALNDFRWVE